MVSRCEWAHGSDVLTREYHDREWGVPVHDDRPLFEMLTLEGAQAGLSWTTILRKRDGYREAFAGFDAARVAGFDDADVARLMADPGIVRNRLKIESTIANARAILRAGDLDALLWGLAGGSTVVNRWRTLAEVPSQTPASKAMSKELRRRGFRFVGPTVCYALMQAVGMVDDHVVSCFRHTARRVAATGSR